MTTETTTRTASQFEKFVASGYGRAARVTLGVGLVAAGTVLLPPAIGLPLALFGLVPITTGLFNLCPVAPLWGGHFLGSRYCAAASRNGTQL